MPANPERSLDIPEDAMTLIVEADAVEYGIRLAIAAELEALQQELTNEENADVLWRHLGRRATYLRGI